MNTTEEPQVEEKPFKQDMLLSIAQRIAKGEAGYFVYCLQDGKFYTYELGVWREILTIELLDKVCNKILNTKGFKMMNKLNINQRKQVLENLKIVKYMPISGFNCLPLINLENYMFDPVGINVLAHKKEFYSTIRIPYKYDEKAKCELWLKTIDDIFEGDKNKTDLLQEFMGYCLTRDTRMEKAMLLLGESRSGKSTILNTLQYMIGDVNCSHVPLMNLENPQYTSMMLNKLVNIDGEVSKKAEDFESQFKTIVTGHEVNCNDKYMPPFKFRPFCKFVMSANEFPKITDHSSAFYKRLILIPCNRVFEPHEQNRNLRNELLTELSGVLNWSIEGLRKLIKRGQFEEKQFMKEAVSELEDENNPVNEFFKEFIEVEMSGNSYIEKTDLFKKYKQWCIDNKQFNLSNIRFSICLHKKFHKETPKISRLSNNGALIWRNLRYIQKNHVDNRNAGYTD